MQIKSNETYGEFCKRIRYACKLTQDQFALKVGISKSSIYLYEVKGNTPNFTNQKKLDEFARQVK